MARSLAILSGWRFGTLFAHLRDMHPTSEPAAFAETPGRALDDWAYIVIDDTTYPCSARRLSLTHAHIDNVVVAVGERLKLYVHLPSHAGGVSFLALSGQVCWTDGHRARIELTRMDLRSRSTLLAWLDEFGGAAA